MFESLCCNGAIVLDSDWPRGVTRDWDKSKDKEAGQEHHCQGLGGLGSKDIGFQQYLTEGHRLSTCPFILFKAKGIHKQGRE
jgi:hypothetical protein